MFEQVVKGLAQLTGCDRDALSALLERPSSEASTTQLVERIGAAERLAAAVQALQVRDMAAFNAAELAAGDREPVGGDRDPSMDGVSRVVACEVAKACRVAVVTAGTRVATATRAVTDHPEVLALVGSGRVSMAGLNRVVAETLLLDPPARPEVDAGLAADARRRSLTPGELGRCAARRVLAADPEAATRRVRRARARRDVRLLDPVDGTAAVLALLRAEEAQAVWEGLDTAARALRNGGDERALDQLRADLFLEQLLGRSLVPVLGPAPVWRRQHGVEPAFECTAPPADWQQQPDPTLEDSAWDQYAPAAAQAPVSAAERPPLLGRLQARRDVEVQVVVSLATVLGLDDEPGLLRGYGAVPADTIREIVDVAGATGGATRLRRLFCDPTDGRLLAMESSAELFRGGLAQFARWRDQHDRLTGGPIGDLDHVRDRRYGGRTAAANAQALGTLNNRVVKNDPRVQVHAVPVEPQHDGLDAYRAHAPDIRWTLPSGQQHVSRPPPALGLGSESQDEPPAASASVLERHLRHVLDLAA